MRTDKNNNFKFTIKFLMTPDRSYIGYLGFLGIDLFRSVLTYLMAQFASLNYFLKWVFLQCSITLLLNFIRMAKDKKDLAVFKGLLR